ncbi:MAG: GDP-mannose 4,6-dehydratase [Candidatus Odinarchaeota archaeon]
MDDKLTSQLEDRTVLVTGSDGFVGSHMLEKLLECGAIVHGLVRATSSGMLHNSGHLRDKVAFHRGDLGDKHAVRKALEHLKGCADCIIIHIGAQAHVGESWGRPYETIESNVLGTLNVLHSVLDLDLDVYRIDVAGSSEEYGNIREDVREHYRFLDNGALILDERSPLNPQSVYATSKVAQDFLTRNFYSAYGIPGIVTRMFNNYGPRQNPRFVTGTIITQALDKNTVNLGYVLAKRDFCYVEDGVRGHLYATLFGNPGETYVYGYGKNTSILEWFNMINRIGEEEGYWKNIKLQADTEGRGRLGKSEVEELRVDYSKLNKLTGWEPTIDWNEGLRRTIRWYVENPERWKHRVDWK